MEMEGSRYCPSLHEPVYWTGWDHDLGQPIGQGREMETQCVLLNVSKFVGFVLPDRQAKEAEA
jgi:hypothetical protein